MTCLVYRNAWRWTRKKTFQMRRVRDDDIKYFFVDSHIQINESVVSVSSTYKHSRQNADLRCLFAQAHTHTHTQTQTQPHKLVIRKIRWHETKESNPTKCAYVIDSTGKCVLGGSPGTNATSRKNARKFRVALYSLRSRPILFARLCVCVRVLSLWM